MGDRKPNAARGAKLSGSVSPAIVERDEGWALRLAQLARLAQLEALLKQESDGETALTAAIERAVLLAALDRRDDAKLAFIAILAEVAYPFQRVE
jgi:hypothetical protein